MKVLSSESGRPIQLLCVMCNGSQGAILMGGIRLILREDMCLGQSMKRRSKRERGCREDRAFHRKSFSGNDGRLSAGDGSVRRFLTHPRTVESSPCSSGKINSLENEESVVDLWMSRIELGLTSLPFPFARPTLILLIYHDKTPIDYEILELRKPDSITWGNMIEIQSVRTHANNSETLSAEKPGQFGSE